MSNKAILILADGMRPDALEACGNPYAMELYARSAHTMQARTVMPSVTLPCHMSLSQRHTAAAWDFVQCICTAGPSRYRYL